RNQHRRRKAPPPRHGDRPNDAEQHPRWVKDVPCRCLGRLAKRQGKARSEEQARGAERDRAAPPLHQRHRKEEDPVVVCIRGEDGEKQEREKRSLQTARSSEIVLIRCDDWIGLEMYAFAPRARPRSRSSSAPSVVMMMMGMALSCAFCRTSDTSFSPSITGMLMSVRMRSILSGPESFFSASTPSTASMIFAFLN